MAEPEWLAKQFEAHRAHLRKVAYRILGSVNEADDAVQESWFRISRADADAVENLGGWLTTIVGRICLDKLRARRQRREEQLDAIAPEDADWDVSPMDLEQDAMLADSVGQALLLILDKLAPAERIAYVLHDMFDLSFDEIALIIGRSTEAARQLASRGRRRIRSGGKLPDTDRARQRQVVEAFLGASRNGDFDALIALLDPEVMLRADRIAAPDPRLRTIRGAAAVARRALMFSGRAPSTRLVLVNGAVGAAWFQNDQPTIVFDFTVAEGKVVGLDVIAEPESLRNLDLANLDQTGFG
jgi:RNA polymerase sigma factor (sigma-70 family)